MSESSGNGSDVLRATAALCRKKGYDSVDIESIAEAAGVSAAWLREQWPSKSAIVIDAFRAEVARDLVYPDTGDFEADLRTQLRAIATVFREADLGPYIARLVGEAQRDPAVTEEFLERVYAPNRKAARARFQQARAAGQLRDDVDLDAAIDLTFAPFWFRLLLKCGAMTDDYVETIVDLSLRGLRPA